MKKCVWGFILYLFAFTGQAQTLSNKELFGLHTILTDFLNQEDTVKPKENRKTEIVFIFLETDSAGKISNLHLMVDENNKDAIYPVIKRLTKEYFKFWKSGKCKKSIIALPFCSGGTGKDSDYTTILYGNLFSQLQRPFGTVLQKNNVIIARPFLYVKTWGFKAQSGEKSIQTSESTN